MRGGYRDTRPCSYCGARNPVEVRYCRECGREVAGGLRLDAGPEPALLGDCRNCGGALYEGDQRCPICRAPVAGTTGSSARVPGKELAGRLGRAIRRALGR